MSSFVDRYKTLKDGSLLAIRTNYGIEFKGEFIESHNTLEISHKFVTLITAQ